MTEQNNQRGTEDIIISMIHDGSDLCGYHIPRRQGIFPAEYAKRYKMPEVVDNVPELAVMIGLVAPQSKDDWFSMFAAIDSGSLNGSSKIFMRHLDGTYVRYWMRYSTFLDDNGQPLIALITFDNISAEYEASRRQSHNVSALLQAAEKSFTDILSYNLTQNSCRLISCNDAVFDPMITTEQQINDTLSLYLGQIPDEDLEDVKRIFSHDNLVKAFIEDKVESLSVTYRRYNKNGVPIWFQSTITRQSNEVDDDILLVITSRNIDAQKAEEFRLTNELWLQSEEIRVTTGKLGRVIFYYDIPQKTLTVPREYAEKHNMPLKMSNYPDSISLAFRAELPETHSTIWKFYEAIQQGEPSGYCELAFNPRGTAPRWQRWEYATVFDREGNPSRAIIFVEDITNQHLQASEIKRLRSTEQFSRIIAQHSDRTVYFYDVKKTRLRPWEEIVSGHKSPSAGQTPVQSLLSAESITPDDPTLLDEMFTDIHAGVPQGGMKLHSNMQDETSRWFDVRFSTIFGDSNEPVSAVISLKDVTEQYELELTYLRHLQAMQNSEAHLGSVEVDLQTGIIETQSGRMLPSEVVAVGNSMTSVADYMLSLRMVHDSDRVEAKKFFSVEFLSEQYVLGIRRLERTWQMIFHNGTPGWIHTEADLVLDPYSQHRKAFFRLTDITKEKNEQMEMLIRSEQDGMTGLLNRATTEARLRELLAEEDNRGILLLLDLDDLKGINDTFGHSEGDRAIRSISETLKLHFREGDIIGRIGGDEFLIYLPGAADNQDAISASVSNLLRKLTRMPIGENNERRIHCSIGCSSQQPGDTFDSLYKRADLALYSIKRSGKNNYAFYTPSMEEENHHFQAQRLLSQRSTKKANIAELQYLLTALTDLYEAVVAFNLTTRDYFLLEEDRKGAFSALPSYGTMADFVSATRMGVHPDDVESFMGWLAGDTLMQAYERGERNVRYYCRFYNNGSFQWVEVAVVLYVNEDGDLCDFTLLRWADERTHELDQLAVTKALELAVNNTFESISLIDISTGQYTRFGESTLGRNIPAKRSYDETIKLMRDHIADPAEQERYYNNAKLSSVITHMETNGSSYSFSYTLPSGSYEASFDWLDSTHAQLFLTVRKLDA